MATKTTMILVLACKSAFRLATCRDECDAACISTCSRGAFTLATANLCTLSVVHVKYAIMSHWGFPVLWNSADNLIDNNCYIFYLEEG